MHKPSQPEDTGHLNPIALTLAVWLGLIAGVAGLDRLSQENATREALADASGTASASSEIKAFSTQMTAFGG